MADSSFDVVSKVDPMIGENLLSPAPTLLQPEPAVTQQLRTGCDLEQVVRDHPESPLAWALLADKADAEGRQIQSYAFARVGYHRGLDALRAAGWRGAGPVPWSHEPNRGVLRALYALRRSATRIGEIGEVERLTQFLDGADPEVRHTLGKISAPTHNEPHRSAPATEPHHSG